MFHPVYNVPSDDINYINSKGQTWLHRAIEYMDFSKIKIFVEAGARVNLPERIFLSANRFIDIEPLLIGAVRPWSERRIKESYVSDVEDILRQQIKIIKFLLRSGVDVNATDSYRWTALHYAVPCEEIRPSVLANQVRIIQLLGQYKAYHIPDGDRHLTPLHCACEKQELEIITALLEIGANPNAVDLYGHTPLHDVIPSSDAKLQKSIAIMKVLFQYGAKIIPSGTLQTPLHLVTGTFANLEIVSLLISHGDDIYAKNNDGRTPLDNVSDPELKHQMIQLYIKGQADS